MAHRHDQKAQIISTEAPVDLDEVRQKDQAAARSNSALGLAGSARRVEKSIGIVRPDFDRRFRPCASRDQVLIGSEPRGRSVAEMDVLVLSYQALGSDCFNAVEKIVLDDNGFSF